MRPRGVLAASPRGVLVAALLTLVVACGDPATVTDPRRTTAISLTPDSVNLTFVGETTAFTASVTDQFGWAFPASVTWNSDAPEVFSVTADGAVTASANGSGTVTAALERENLRATAYVTVRQVPAFATLASGGQQEALPSTVLPDPVVVEVKDRGGVGVGDVPVVFTPADGHGSATPRTASTNSFGQTATIWTLGAGPGYQLLTASTRDNVSARVTANSTYGASIDIVSGNRQRAFPGTSLTDPIVIRVSKTDGDPFAGTTVHFSPGQGHGHVSHESVTADQAGEVAVLWTLGDNTGSHTLTASLPGGLGTELTAVLSLSVATLPPAAFSGLTRLEGLTLIFAGALIAGLERPEHPSDTYACCLDVAPRSLASSACADESPCDSFRCSGVSRGHRRCCSGA